MKKIIIRGIIGIIGVLFILFSILFIIEKINNNKANEKIKNYEQIIKDSKQYLIDRDNKILELKKIKTKTVKEFIYLKDEEKNNEYEKLNNKYNELEGISNKDKDKIEELTKDLEKCKKDYETEYKKKNKKVMFLPVVNIGFDSGYNLNSRIGIILNGFLYNGKLISVSMGGGGAYSQRYDFVNNKNIPGGDLILNLALYF